MAVKLVTIYWSHYNSGISKTEVRGLLEADTLADLPSPDDITGYRLTIGCEANIIDTAARYKMDSSGSWHVQEQGTDFYTKSEIDAMLEPRPTRSGIWGQGTEIPEYANIFDYGIDADKPVGIYYSPTSARTATLYNRPFSGSGFKMIVYSISTTSKQLEIRPISSGLAASHIYICSHTTSGWASWYEISGSAVPTINPFTP